MRSCISLASCAFMVFQKPLSLIVVLNLLPTFRGAFRKLWEPTSPIALLYHPQTDDQTERVNQILEDMLQACALIYEKKWVTCLPFAEFSYNNSYQASIKMSPFKAL